MSVNIKNIATFNKTRLYQGQPGISSATLGTAVPASTDWRLTEIVLCNTTATAASVSVSVVPSGGTAGVTNRIVEQMSIPGYGASNSNTVVIGLNTVLTTGDFLAGVQGTTGAITVTITGEVYA